MNWSLNLNKTSYEVDALYLFPAELPCATKQMPSGVTSQQQVSLWGMREILGRNAGPALWAEKSSLVSFISLPKAPASSGSHSWSTADIKAKVGSSCVWYARVVVGVAGLELRWEFVEKRTGISSAWNTAWSFENTSFGSATRPVQFWLNPAIRNIHNLQNHAYLITGL